jgi:hypothetical protein
MRVEIRHTFESNVDVFSVERVLKEFGYELLLLPPCPLPSAPIKEEVAGRNVICFRQGFDRVAERIKRIVETVCPVDEVFMQNQTSLGLPEPLPGMPHILDLINEEIVIYLNRC